MFQGLVRYRVGPDGLPDRLHDTALGVFTDPALLPVVFPGLLEEVEAHLQPSERETRIVDIDLPQPRTAETRNQERYFELVTTVRAALHAGGADAATDAAEGLGGGEVDAGRIAAEGLT